MLFVDLDDFKVINDSLGHTVGDELLVAAGHRLARLAGPRGIVARLGGDEFALLVEDAPDGAAVEASRRRSCQAFADPFPLAVGSAIATATVGVATSPGRTSPGDLARHADLALYAAKAAGKRQWRSYQPVLSAGMKRRRELQAALDAPWRSRPSRWPTSRSSSSHRGGLAGFEALVRWPHADWGMLTARPVHLTRRGDRAHRPARLMGAAPGHCRRGPLAARPAQPCTSA